MNSIDGRQLAFPGTGLAVVTGELVSALPSIAREDVAVFVPSGWPAMEFSFPREGLRFIEVAYQSRRPDYLDRISWSTAVQRIRAREGIGGRHFIPYLYNYGAVKDNVVMIPDLVYRLHPDYGMRDPGLPWWNLRGRLPFRPLVRRWEESRASSAQRIVVISEFARRQVHELLGVPLDRLTVLALAAPRWISDAPSDAILPAGMPERFTLYTGGYAVRKNVPMLLRVCGRVFQKDPSFRCAFVGLTDEIVSHYAAIREALTAPGVQQSVVRTGRVSNRVMAAAYHCCAFVLYPSHAEGFGLPIVEAFACGKVCLCGDNSAMREVEARSDFRIASNDEGRWYARVLHLWQHPDEYQRAGRESHAMDPRSRWNESARTLWRLLCE